MKSRYEDRRRSDRRKRTRATAVAASLAVVLALQLRVCADKLNRPFLDTRLHYDYDTAFFGFLARNGNRNGDLRSQFGVTIHAYSRWGERRGRPTYYTNHPFLFRALFQQFTRLTGTPEWAPRVFSLILAFATAAGTYVVLLQATLSLFASLGGAAVLVSLPVFGVYQTALKTDADGMLAGVWLCAALFAFLRKGNARSLAAAGLLAAVAVLAAWTSAMLLAALVVFVAAEALFRRSASARRAFAALLLGGLAGAAVLAGLMVYLQGGIPGARAALARSAARRAASIPAADWWARQASYARANFGGAFPWIALGLSLVLALRRVRSTQPPAEADSEPPRNLLAAFFGTTLLVACVWLLAFREGSFVHVFWQYWFCFPIAALFAAFLASLPANRYLKAAGCAAVIAAIVYFSETTRTAYAGVLDDQLGTGSDIEFLKSLRGDRFDRFVFVPISETELNDWFQGPLFEYYTDRAVVTSKPERGLRPGEKVLVLKYKDRPDVVSQIEEGSGRKLDHEKCGERLCAYDVEP